MYFSFVLFVLTSFLSLALPERDALYTKCNIVAGCNTEQSMKQKNNDKKHAATNGTEPNREGESENEMIFTTKCN